MGGIIKRAKDSAKHLKREIHALYLAYKDPRVPWYAKVFTMCVVGYALSPIDLIPDCIPVLGYLDDLVLLPIGIWLALKMIPPHVLEECRQTADAGLNPGQSGKYLVAGLVVAIWTLALVFSVACMIWLMKAMGQGQ
jgi:uncharacterized membrane protein YkvA (DUF1232 family)